MNEIIKKVNKEISDITTERINVENSRERDVWNNGYDIGKRDGRLILAKNIVMSENTLPCYNPNDCEYKKNEKCYIQGPCPHLEKPQTNGDRIRESNQSLAKFVMEVQDDTTYGSTWATIDKCMEYLDRSVD